jgi:hypothetical protein
MPQIPEYNPRIGGLQPSERGTTAELQAARRTGAFYNEAAGMISAGARSQSEAASDVARSASGVARDVSEAAIQQENFAGHREVSAGAASGAQLFANLSDQWDKTVKKADPNDPSVAAKFREQVLEPALEEFKGGYSNTDRGMQWSESWTERTRNHFFQKTSADMSTLAADAVAVNVRNLSNASQTTALKSPDFHTIDYLLGEADNSVGQIVDSSSLKGADSARVRTKLTEDMKEKIVKSGAMGAIQKSGDPEATADEFTKRYPNYITGDEARQFAAAARGAARLNNAEARAARSDAERAAKQDFRQKINALEGESIPDNPGDPPKMPQNAFQRLRELSNHPGAEFEAGRLRTTITQFETIADRQNKPEPMARVSHAATAKLLGDIRDGKMADPGAIYDQYRDGKLNNGDFNFLLKAHQDLRSPEGVSLNATRGEFFKRYASSIDGAMDFAGHSALGQQKLYTFEMDARRVENDLRTKGLDPHLAYDPSSEFFLGKPANLSKYHVSMQEGMKYQQQVSGEPDKSTDATPKKEPVVTSKEDYDRLPSGTNFTSGGKKFRKP